MGRITQEHFKARVAPVDPDPNDCPCGKSWGDCMKSPADCPQTIPDAHWTPSGPVSHLSTDSAARKGIPLATGLLDYFPDALADVARLSLASNEKHNPGEPLRWSREKSSDHADALLRHMVDRGALDHDGLLHDTKVAWRALANLQLTIERLRAEGRY